MELITQRLKLVDIYPDRAEQLAKKYNRKPEELELVRKGMVSRKIEVDEKNRAVVSYITTGEVDRDKEIVVPDGVDLKHYNENRVVMWAHRYADLPIGRNLWIKPDEKGLRAKTHFFPAYKNPLSEQLYRLYTEPIFDDGKDTGPGMRAWSIGFVPLEWEDLTEKDGQGGARRKYTKWELLEYSAVPVPSNPEALTVAIGKGLELDKELQRDLGIEIDDVVHKPEETENYIRLPVKGEEGKHEGHKIRTITVSEKEGIKGLYCVDCKKIITYIFDKRKGWTMEKAKKWMKDHGKAIEWLDGMENPEEVVEDILEGKGIIPFKDTGKAPEDTEWDAGKEVREAEVSDLKVMCAWFDSEKPDIKTSYKLPHHQASGKHLCVWRAVAAAMAALLGARGGVQIPDGDRKGVYNHLAKHYRQFDKKPPEFREYTGEELEEIFGFDVKSSDFDERISKKLIQRVETLANEIAEMKEGRVLSEKNRRLIGSCVSKMNEAIVVLNELIQATEPPKPEKIDLSIIEDPKHREDENLKKKDVEVIVSEILKEFMAGLKKQQNKIKKKIDLARGKVE